LDFVLGVVDMMLLSPALTGHYYLSSIVVLCLILILEHKLGLYLNSCQIAALIFFSRGGVFFCELKSLFLSVPSIHICVLCDWGFYDMLQIKTWRCLVYDKSKV
jgi:hypothetical protein